MQEGRLCPPRRPHTPKSKVIVVVPYGKKYAGNKNVCAVLWNTLKIMLYGERKNVKRNFKKTTLVLKRLKYIRLTGHLPCRMTVSLF